MTEPIDYGRLAVSLADVLDRREERKPKPERLDATKVEDIARRAAKEAVEAAVPLAISQTLLSFGLNPLQAGDIQRDMIFIRDMRMLSADSKKHILLVILGSMTLGVVAAVWLYLKTTGKAP